jgi:hypothetical protein
MERTRTTDGTEAYFRDLDLLLADAAAERSGEALPPPGDPAPVAAPASFDEQILAALVFP